MYLTIYDISGIQSYIFATNKLKEQIGGSQIVHYILYQLLPENLGDSSPDAWMQPGYPLGDFSERQGNVVYIGGGNAVVLYPNKEVMINITRTLQKKVFLLTGGGLRLCHASSELISLQENRSYAEVQQDLMEKLSSYKRTTPPLQSTAGFSFGAQDNMTQEPVLLHSNHTYGALSRYQKRLSVQKTGGTSAFGISDMKFSTDFESFRSPNRKSFLAVIHIDGNTMGQKIMAFVAHLKKTGCSLHSSMLAMRSLSAEIDTLYKTALIKAIQASFPDANAEEALPFRPVVLDGDDVTVILAAEKAFAFTENFMLSLKQESSNAECYPSLCEHNFCPSAGAGIAFVHDKFPFYVAYDMAEQLCKSAKEKARSVHMPNHSSMDFQVIQSGITTQIKNYREKNYEFYKKGELYRLTLRPYLFDCDEVDGEEPPAFSYTSFQSLRDTLCSSDRTLARSKLKGLRSAYGQGVLAAEEYGRFIASRHLEDSLAQKLAVPFYKNQAVYFDALDVMDFEEGDEENGRHLRNSATV